MAFLNGWSPQLLSILRIMSGLLFLEHGTAKLLGIPHVTMYDAGLSPLLLAAGIIELTCGVLITAGFFTRIAAFICSGEMAVGYFLYHMRMGGFFPAVNQGDAAILFCFIFLYIAAAGPGPWSIDAKRGRTT